MRPLSVVTDAVVGAAGVVQDLFVQGGIEEYSQVPTDEDWIIDWLAVEMTANPGTWVLRAAGVEIASGVDQTVAAPGSLDLNFVPRLGVRIPGGTKLVWQHTAAGTTLTSLVHLQGRRFRRGQAL